ncbi:MAG TPA: LamG domain-containing protein [Thermoanaerobaculia bacterium]|jgi:hypothetical protein|nr:LamG domain-containing protein [Thermoanaerobaculia bacterium]
MRQILRTVPLLFVVAALLAVAPANAGTAGGALHCDGTNDVVTIPDAGNDFDFNAAMTLEAWVRADGSPQTGPIVGGFQGPQFASYVLAANPSAGTFLSISTPGTNSAYGPAFAPGVWMHLAGTYDGSTIRVYVNGVQVGSAAHSGNVSSVIQLRICRFPHDITDYLNGVVDEVRVWNVVRSAGQILNSYQHSLAGNEPGLVGYYRFDEGSGQVVVDSSNAGNDGFLGASASAGTDDPTRVMSGAGLLAPGPCVRDAHTACLLDDRFEVRVTMKNFAVPPAMFPGIIQLYQAVSSETDQSVSFYSFQEGNVEVFVKMVDACASPSFVSFWLFAAGATNAETSITVRDTLADEVTTIHNASGSLFQTVADTSAFKTCGF